MGHKGIGWCTNSLPGRLPFNPNNSFLLRHIASVGSTRTFGFLIFFWPPYPDLAAFPLTMVGTHATMWSALQKQCACSNFEQGPHSQTNPSRILFLLDSEFRVYSCKMAPVWFSLNSAKTTKVRFCVALRDQKLPCSNFSKNCTPETAATCKYQSV